MTVGLVEEADPYPIMREAVKNAFEYHLDNLEVLRLHLELAVLTFERGNIYPDLGELITEDVEIRWPSFEGYGAEPCPICEQFHAGEDDDTVLIAEIVEDDTTLVRETYLPSIDENARRQLQYYEGLPG